MRKAIIAVIGLAIAVPVLAADWSLGQTYTYDGSGNIKQIGTDQQSYDGAQRLLTSSTNGIVRTHGYDKYGNYIDCAQAGGTDCQPYDISTSNNRLTAATYDTAGNVTNFNGHAYTYDAANMQSSDVNGSLITEYIYTAGDERIAVYVPNTGSWRWTLRDASGKVLRELRSQNPASGTIGTGSWSWVKDYVWREGLLLASRQIEPGASTPVTYNYHLDHLGTARVITDASDQVVGAHEYYPFGDEQSGGQNEASLTPLKFTGHERDPDLDYMHARYYDWRRGRFLSVDPAQESADRNNPQTWNRYAYAVNNPINAADPDGRQCQANVPPAASMSAEDQLWESFKKLFPIPSAENPIVLDPQHRPLETAANVLLIASLVTPFAGDEIVGTTARSVLADARFAQRTYSNAFSAEGKLAGRTVDEVTSAIQNGVMRSKDVPVDYIVRDGNTLILNTRSAVALEQAGVSRAEWAAVNRTGQGAYEARLTEQLQRNRLTSEGTKTVRRSGSGATGEW